MIRIKRKTFLENLIGCYRKPNLFMQGNKCITQDDNDFTSTEFLFKTKFGVDCPIGDIKINENDLMCSKKDPNSGKKGLFLTSYIEDHYSTKSCYLDDREFAEKFNKESSQVMAKIEELEKNRFLYNNAEDDNTKAKCAMKIIDLEDELNELDPEKIFRNSELKQVNVSENKIAEELKKRFNLSDDDIKKVTSQLVFQSVDEVKNFCKNKLPFANIVDKQNGKIIAWKQEYTGNTDPTAFVVIKKTYNKDKQRDEYTLSPGTILYSRQLSASSSSLNNFVNINKSRSLAENNKGDYLRDLKILLHGLIDTLKKNKLKKIC